MLSTFNLTRKQPFQRFIPICHHFGKLGLTRPNCYRMKPREPKSEISFSKKVVEGLCKMMKRVLIRVNDLDKRHNFVFEVRKVWVRKDDTIHH